MLSPYLLPFLTLLLLIFIKRLQSTYVEDDEAMIRLLSSSEPKKIAAVAVARREWSLALLMGHLANDSRISLYVAQCIENGLLVCFVLDK